MISIQSDDATSFKEHLVRLAADERVANVEFLLALAEFERRELYLDFGCTTLWRFCTDVLRLRPSATHLRVSAVKILGRVPKAADALRDGRLSISTLVALGPFLTPENLEEWVARAAFRSRADVKRLIAPLKNSPPPAADYLRRAPAAPTPTDDRNNASKRGEHLKPTPDPEWLLRARISERVRQKLERARALAAEQGRGASWEAVLEALADNFLAAPEPKRTGSGVALDSRGREEAIAIGVQKIVGSRDGQCCNWRHPTGYICGSRSNLRFGRIIAAAEGGSSAPSNVRLLCSRHYAQQRAHDRRRKSKRRHPNGVAGRSLKFRQSAKKQAALASRHVRRRQQ